MPRSWHLAAANFYPRPPRGGRQSAIFFLLETLDFYPRPPRGGRRYGIVSRGQRSEISIHALREEGDSTPTAGCPSRPKFLSTPSARRATLPSAAARPFHQDFYPRPPRGGRLGGFLFLILGELFLSTPSARRATHQHRTGGQQLWISIHALREEGDFWIAAIALTNFLFLSTPSARRATFVTCRNCSCAAFLSTPSARRAT